MRKIDYKSKFGAGISHDRFGLRVTMLLCGIAAVIAFVTLALVTPTATGKILAMIFGVFVSINTAGYAIGTPLLNAVYDVQGTYKSVL